MNQEAERNTPAMQQFKTIFMDDEKRNNREEWRNFFISHVFLDEQYNAEYVVAMHQFLQQQEVVPFVNLPDGLVVELAIVYVLWPKEKDFLVVIDAFENESDLYDLESAVVFENVAGHIWNQQENIQNNFMELQSKASFIRRKSYDEYRTIRDFAINDMWTYKRYSDDMEEYKYTLSMAHWEFIADDNKVNSMDIEDIRLEDDITHACEVELYDYLLCKYGFPVEPCAYMYKYFELENIENTEFAEVYKDLKAHILALYPDMNEYYKCNISAVDYADDLQETLKLLQEKYEKSGWGKNLTNLYQPCYATEVVDWCEEEAEQVRKIVNSGLFQKYKYEERVISNLIVSQFSVTEAKIFYEIYNKPELYMENSRMMRLLHTLYSRIHIYGMQEQYLATKEYEYNLGMDSFEFWEYFLSVAFGDCCVVVDSKADSPIPGGSLYADKMTLPTYMRWTYKPSMEWRIRFVNYDKEKGSFGELRKVDLKINEELTVTIEFHYHYVRYYVNGAEVVRPVFDVPKLLDYAKDDTSFILLLPIADIYAEHMQAVFDRLLECLPQKVRFPASVRWIARMISRNNASIYEHKAIKTRHYIENLTDCYRLDKYKNGKQKLYHFHPKYGCWEDVGEEMIGRHFRDRLFGEPDDEGWDMKHFKESDLTLSYEVETKVHEFGGLKTKEKIAKLLELFEKNNNGEGEEEHFLKDNQVILVFGDKNRMQLRQHFNTGVMLNQQMENEAYAKYQYLSMKTKSLLKYAKETLKWKGFFELENFRDAIPVAEGVSGSFYAHGVPYGKGLKAKDFGKLLDKMICLDDLTQVIEYEVQKRSEWDCGESMGCLVEQLTEKQDIKEGEIYFKSKWFEKCIRDYLQIGDRPILAEELNAIKYMAVETTHSHQLAFGTGSLPSVFIFEDAGDEWDCCCISNTGQYSKLEEFITINEWAEFKTLEIREEVLEAEAELSDNEFFDEAAMKEFRKTVKDYWAKSEDYAGVEEDEDAYISGMIFPEDFVPFKNLEVLRLMTCELDIHSLKFLKELPNLKILEIGEVRLADLEGIEKLIGLDKLTIWSN